MFKICGLPRSLLSGAEEAVVLLLQLPHCGTSSLPGESTGLLSLSLSLKMLKMLSCVLPNPVLQCAYKVLF